MSRPALRPSRARTTVCPTCGAGRLRPCVRIDESAAGRSRTLDHGVHVNAHAARVRAERLWRLGGSEEVVWADALGNWHAVTNLGPTRAQVLIERELAQRDMVAESLGAMTVVALNEIEWTEVWPQDAR